ncbi:MAG: hypothetical protein ACLP2X_02165, partial [Syntrophobacteraceae bacterium]
ARLSAIPADRAEGTAHFGIGKIVGFTLFFDRWGAFHNFITNMEERNGAIRFIEDCRYLGFLVFTLLDWKST